MWKWYVKESEKSWYHSPYPIDGAQEVQSPPDSNIYKWNFDLKKWELDVETIKSLALAKVNAELERLKMFDALPEEKKSLIKNILSAYRNELRLFIKEFDPLKTFPYIPSALTEKSFFSL